MRMMKISVIVPVFNAEEYIDCCMKSLLNQTYDNYEIILVDDGSSDLSFSICSEYEKKYDKVKAITKNNGGSNSARREGVLIAEGEYVTFVDIDDWVESDFLENFVNSNKDVIHDMVISGGIIEDGSNKSNVSSTIEKGIYSTIAEKTKLYSHLMIVDYKWGILPALWGKLIRRELVKDVIMRISEQIYYGEDTGVWVACILNCKSINIVEYNGYHYIVRGTSISRTKSTRIFSNILLLHDFLEEEFNKSDFKDYLWKQLETYTLNLMKYAVSSMWGYKCDFINNYIIKSDEKNDKNASGEKNNINATEICNSIFREYKNRLWVLNKNVLEENKRILVFGAGAVGYSYIYQLENEMDNYEIVAWTDNDNKIKSVAGHDVIPIDDALKIEYDIILIAVLKEEDARNIRDQLISKGVGNDKIVWSKPWRINNCLYKLKNGEKND